MLTYHLGHSSIEFSKRIWRSMPTDNRKKLSCETMAEHSGRVKSDMNSTFLFQARF